jgi:uncharacterized Tic20 family protein
MDELAQNHRNFVTSTVIMLVVSAVIITAGMILFPLTAYDDPNAGLIRGLINSPAGNAIVLGLFAVLAVNVGVFLNRVVQLEKERAAILEKSSSKADATPLQSGKKTGIGAPKS